MLGSTTDFDRTAYTRFKRLTAATSKVEVQRAAHECVIFHYTLDTAETVRRLQGEGQVIDPENLAHISPYLTEHIRRFGEYSTHELGALSPRRTTRTWTSASARSAARTLPPQTARGV
ncbi:Tn3 family transposase [Streptomyces sp. A1547]|uniref:Tn3 family transposase n=1 Tax=Streptomyces sp. A1547 TaxID=2563105 RepID=UPI00109ED70D|nr:Tn3 family transposase [Streptomyces sp. A1547]THA30667.1 hypothetical protein E6W17_37285 [Streptomyces sp. A1547]